MNITIRGDSARDVAGRFVRMSAEMTARMPGVVSRGGEIIRQEILSRAQGRPGPEAITGDYLRSWKIDRRGPLEEEVYSDADQARRLELGFVGVDALGREYDQPPFPHVGPGVSAAKPKITAGFDRLVSTIIKAGAR